jgi:hypothetical protein
MLEWSSRRAAAGIANVLFSCSVPRTCDLHLLRSGAMDVIGAVHIECRTGNEDEEQCHLKSQAMITF